MKLSGLALTVLGLLGTVTMASVQTEAMTCTAYSSRGHQYDGLAEGTDGLATRQTAINNCGPNCNGRKGSLLGVDCEGEGEGGGGNGGERGGGRGGPRGGGGGGGFPGGNGGGSGQVTCIAFSSRGPSYNAIGTGSSMIEARNNALTICGPNCNGKKGNLVNVQCD